MKEVKELFFLADRIRFFRQHMALSQNELGKKLNVTRPTINGWELGITIPELDKIESLAKFFNVSTDFLLGIEENAAIDVNALNTEEIAILSEFIDRLKRKKVKKI